VAKEGSEDEFVCLGWFCELDGDGAERRGAQNRRCSRVYVCWKTLKLFQFVQRPNPRFRPVAVFRMSCWNKQIGFEGRAFGQSKGFFAQLLQMSNVQIARVFTMLCGGR
jgi:hypothetical protein